MDDGSVTVVFTPDNEPYLGRVLLVHFDQIICSVMERNSVLAPQTHSQLLSDQQRMACQVIPQALSIMLSIRELIRQGYLLGAHVLVRALVERAAILLYIHNRPGEIEKWNRGWNIGDAPGLSRMLEAIQEDQKHNELIRGRDLTASMNSLLHAKPDSAPWNLVVMGEGVLGHASSKITNRPDLCDDLCANVLPWTAVVLAMMCSYFAQKPTS